MDKSLFEHSVYVKSDIIRGTTDKGPSSKMGKTFENWIVCFLQYFRRRILLASYKEDFLTITWDSGDLEKNYFGAETNGQ